MAAASKYAQKKAKKRQTKKRKHLLSDVLRGAHTPTNPRSDAHHTDGANGGHRHPNGGSAHADHNDDGDDDDDDARDDGPAVAVSSGGGMPVSAPSSTPLTTTCPLSPSEAFAWMIHPLTPERFFSEYWEKKPLLIRRKRKRYYGDLFTSGALDTMLREHHVKFGVNVVRLNFLFRPSFRLRYDSLTDSPVHTSIYMHSHTRPLTNPHIHTQHTNTYKHKHTQSTEHTRSFTDAHSSTRNFSLTAF